MARPREFDEAVVLKAARNAFWERGYAATSVDDLTAATGLGKGSLYAAFGNKRDLFLRIFGAYCDGGVASAGRTLDGPDETAMQRIESYVASIAQGTISDKAQRGCLLAKGTAELAGSDEEVAARAFAALSSIEDKLVACVAGAQRNGDLLQTIPARKIGRTLLATLRGIEALGKAGFGESAITDIAETALLPFLVSRSSRSTANRSRIKR